MKTDTRFADYVNVFQGNGKIELPTPEGFAASWFFIKAITGNTIPGATLPFGKYSCCTYTGGYPCGYGDNRPNTSPWNMTHMPEGAKFHGLSHFHHSGTGGIGNYYNLARLIPYVGKLPQMDGKTIQKEEGHPGYYRVETKDGLQCEVTVSPLSAYHRFRFPTSDGHILFDATGNNLSNCFKNEKARPVKGRLSIVNSNEIHTELELYGITHHFVNRFTNAHIRSIIQDGQLVDGASLSFDLDASTAYCGVILDADGPVVESRFSDSLVKMEKAVQDCQTNEGGFEDIHSKAKGLWEQYLSKVEIEGISDKEKEIFYSNLYHSLVKPCDRPGDSPWWEDETFVVDFSTMWDTYKTEMPFILMLYPEIGEKIVRSLVSYEKAWGCFPNAVLVDDNRLICSEQAQMLAEHMLCDAFWRGIPGDYEEVLSVIMNDIRHPAKGPILAGQKPRRLTHLLDVCEGCGDVADMARALHHPEIADELQPIADHWRDAFDPQTGLLYADYEYYEGNYWNYSFRLLRHMDERMELAGGKDKYLSLLDRFFGITAPERMDARFEGFNNETDMEAPYAYHVTGRMDRIAAIVEACRQFLFTTGRGGIPGNNDSGGLSSCYMWNMFGIFPVAGQNKMLIGAPQFEKVTLHLPHDHDFVIQKVGDGHIVKQASLNGIDLPDLAFSVTDMMQGGTLQLFT